MAEHAREGGRRRAAARTARSGRRRAAGIALILALGLAAIGRTAVARADPTAAGARPSAVRDATSDESTGRPGSAEALLERLARMPGFFARFEETKTIGLLSTPLVSRGELFFEPPDRLLRHTRSPSEQRVLVDRDRVVLGDGARREQLDLGGDSPIRPLVASLLWVLAGDGEAIGRAYHVDYALDPNGRGWTLRLVPRGAPLDALIAAIEVRGDARLPTAFVVEEANGDVSVTRLSEVDTARRFSASDRASLFDPGAP